MLEIKIPDKDLELWDESKLQFVYVEKGKTIKLEHSLVSLSKWESKWCKPFLTKNQLTFEENLDYIKFMTVTPNVDSIIYNYLTESNIKAIQDYINEPMTATTFFGHNEPKGKMNGEQITAELIYYWMIALNIPFECQKWHLNKLITLIKVCNIKNTPPKKMSKGEIMRRNSALNAARRKRLNTRG